MEEAVFNRDRLDDEYEQHQHRVAPLTKDELDILVANARVSRPRWYNGLIAKLGDGLIAAGSSLKERNSGTVANSHYNRMEVEQ
jgi:hypothetical protein